MKDLRTELERALRNEGAVASPEDLPVECLARELVALGSDPSRVDGSLALLGDGLTGSLLYQTHPDLVLTRLEEALVRLSESQRFALLAATLWMRPLRSEDLVRYAQFSLDALGAVPGEAELLPARWSTDQKLVLYRWAKILTNRDALVLTDVARVFQERGLPSRENPWKTFAHWLDYRATAILTPSMSPTVLHQVKEIQRHDWVDMAWTLGTPGSTFTLDEIDEDSSPTNMEDGRRIMGWLVQQRLPMADFSVSSYAWHPRAPLGEVRRVANEKGLLLLEPAPCDQFPRVVAGHEMTVASRAKNANAVLALAACGEGEIPVDLSLGFYHQGATQVSAVELNVSSTLKNDGSKHQVRLFFEDPARTISAIRAAAALLTPASLPLFLARMRPLCSRVQIVSPGDFYFDVTTEAARRWDPSLAPAISAGVPTAAPTPACAMPAELRGHFAEGTMEELAPLRLELSPMSPMSPMDETTANDCRTYAARVTLPGDSLLEAEVRVEGQRLSLRQLGASTGLVLDGAWNEDAGTLIGHWRMHFQGGTFTLERTADVLESRPEPSIDELLEASRSDWAGHTKLDLEALRFPGEVAHLRLLFEDEHFRAAYAESAKQKEMRTQKRQLDTLVGSGATQLTRAMLPFAFRALDRVVEALGFDGVIHLWAHNAAHLNAFVTEERREITIHLTSGLLEVFQEAELQVVLGHELGHVLLGHHDLALRVQNTNMSTLTQMRYFALRRHQELSTDRVSMLACEDPTSVYLIQTMLRTGIRKRELFGTHEAIVANAQHEVDRLKLRPESERATDSHPYESLRVVAAEWFARAPLFRTLGGSTHSGVASAADPAADAAFEELSRLLDVPEASHAEPGDDSAVKVFTALAAILLAEADGAVSAREARAIVGMDPALAPVLEEVLGWSYERRQVALLARSIQVRRVLSVPKREELLLSLLQIVRADNTTQYAESSQFSELGSILEVYSSTFQKTVEDLYKASH